MGTRRDYINESMQKQLASTDGYEFVPSKQAYYDEMYVCLDSFCKNRTSNTANGEFIWNLSPDRGTDESYGMGIKDSVTSVIEIQFMEFAFPLVSDIAYSTTSPSSKFTLFKNNNSATATARPILNVSRYPPELLQDSATAVNTTPVEADGLYAPEVGPSLVLAGKSTAYIPPVSWKDNPYSQIPFSSRITIQMKGLPMTFSSRKGTDYHVEYFLDYNHDKYSINSYQAIPMNWCVKFASPINEIQNIHFIIRAVDRPIVFAPDVYYNVTLSTIYTQVELNQDNGAKHIRLNIPSHGLAQGDRIFITGCNIQNTTAPIKTLGSELNNYINRVEGHVIGGNPGSGDVAAGTEVYNTGVLLAASSVDYIWFDPNIFVAADTFENMNFSSSVTVYIAKRRIRVPICIRRLVGKKTYI